MIVWMITTNLGISPKEKAPKDLHQNQNFGQVALEFYLAEAFGSEQESTDEHNVATWMKCVSR